MFPFETRVRAFNTPISVSGWTLSTFFCRTNLSPAKVCFLLQSDTNRSITMSIFVFQLELKVNGSIDTIRFGQPTISQFLSLSLVPKQQWIFVRKLFQVLGRALKMEVFFRFLFINANYTFMWLVHSHPHLSFSTSHLRNICESTNGDRQSWFS